MSDSLSAFRRVMHGYDPVEVDRRIVELTHTSTVAMQHARDLHRRVEELTAGAGPDQTASPAAMVDIGFCVMDPHISQVLAIVDDVANQIRQQAATEVAAELASVEASTSKDQADARNYASVVRASGERHAAEVIENATRRAAQLVDGARREAASRREKAEASYEERLASAARAAAEFERALTLRRNQADTGIQQPATLADRILDSALHNAAQLRSEGETAAKDAARVAARIITDAEQSAKHVIAEATSRADRIRSRSEREVSATRLRRDSIDAQMANVQQMLTGLSGTPRSPSNEPDATVSVEAGAPQPTLHH